MPKTKKTAAKQPEPQTDAQPVTDEQRAAADPSVPSTELKRRPGSSRIGG